MERRVSCIACGYPLTGGEAAPSAEPRRSGPPTGTCPECGTSAERSREAWRALGGEAAALERLVRGAALVATLAVTVAVMDALPPHLLSGPPPISDLAKALHWAAGVVSLVLGVAGWRAWWSAERSPPLEPRSSIPWRSRLLLGAWWIAAAGVAVWSVAPERLEPVSLPGALFGAVMWFVLLPVSVALAARVQSDGRSLQLWRRRQVPVRITARILVAVISAYVVVLAGVILVDRVLTDPLAQARWVTFALLVMTARPYLKALLLPALLLALAAAELVVIARAVADLREPAALARLQAVLQRRALIALVALPALLGLGVAYVHVTLYTWGAPSRLTVTDDHPGLLLAGALGGTALLGLVASLAPLLVVKRAIVRATRPGASGAE